MPSHLERRFEPIADVEGDFLWVPVSAHGTAEAAEAFTREYWPERPCYIVEGREWFTTRPVNEDDADDFEFSEEYGVNTIAEPAEPGMGVEYWVVRCYPDVEELA